MSKVKRIFVEKKEGFDIAAQKMLKDLKENLRISTLRRVRIINRYDIEGISEEIYNIARNTIFSEPPVDIVYDENLPLTQKSRIFAVEYLPGQYDQRADSTAQCIQLITHGEIPQVATATVYVLEGEISNEEFEKIKKYCINPVDSREASLDKPETLSISIPVPEDVKILTDFIQLPLDKLKELHSSLGLAMSLEDLVFCRDYFRDVEKRDPTITEIRVLDTYWSDHCRHTTFLTSAEEIEIEKNPLTSPIEEALSTYYNSRKYVYGENERKKPVCLMDIATIAMKQLKKEGILDNLDESDEINACSIVVEAEIEGKKEEWLVMFKNETHNHPTEIEPFGGAATCLGGAIRDPLSGRSWVYQAMRVTGSGDPRTPVEKTLPGKLPQRKITQLAAHGFSSYGNQIGLATGIVSEIYDEGYVAKRMEIGAVIGAAPKSNVVRGKPEEGDLILLIGGRTGRDGCGGATGSSKAHTEKSLTECGAEVQKGNPITERKLQRLFRKPEVSRLIKKCNDFGAGGVSVAVGELAPGLFINLDNIPKKYEGLDGTELAISESQERMAVIISPNSLDKFSKAVKEENLEFSIIGKVQKEPRLQMMWRGKMIVDISREFIDTNGVRRKTIVKIKSPSTHLNYFTTDNDIIDKEELKKRWFDSVSSLNTCSQQGLVEMFDSTIGAGTVLLPFGGLYQKTPIQTMVAKLPVLEGDTTTGTAMSYGYNPTLSKWSPFHGAVFAIVEAVSKIVAVGGDHRKIRLSLQEYFEKLGEDPYKWGKPFSALLGAYFTQIKMKIPAIGGKDSMSGTFKDLNVPPTLVAFAVAPIDVRDIISPEFKEENSLVIFLKIKRDSNEIPDFEYLDKMFSKVNKGILQKEILSAYVVGAGGCAEAITKMCWGNKIGVKIDEKIDPHLLFTKDIGSFVLEVKKEATIKSLFEDLDYYILGETIKNPQIEIGDISISLTELLKVSESILGSVFPIYPPNSHDSNEKIPYYTNKTDKKSSIKIAKPRVLITVFPGTNCEYDTIKAFTKAGAICEEFITKNLSPIEIEESIELMVKMVKNSQIIMIPGGFSAGDEPDGSGKFIAAFFRNPKIKECITEFLEKRDGLMLGICNGFQALIKLGLVPYGKIVDMEPSSPTLTFNTLGRHISKMVYTEIVSVKSPWLSKVKVGDIHVIPISHGEGRFIATKEIINMLIQNGQIATRYTEYPYKGYYISDFNPNGSMFGIEGITSPDGRILGKMGHSERIGRYVGKNIYGEKDQHLFEAGVEYFR